MGQPKAQQTQPGETNIEVLAELTPEEIENIPDRGSAVGPDTSGCTAGLKTLFLANRAIFEASTPHDVMQYALGHVPAILPSAHHASIVIKQSGGQFAQMTVQAYAAADHRPSKTLALSTLWYEKVIDKHKSLLLVSTDKDSGYDGSQAQSTRRTTILTPCLYGDSVRGALRVDTAASSRAFTPDDLVRLSIFGRWIAQAWTHAETLEALKAQRDHQAKENAYLKGREQVRHTEDMLGESTLMKKVLEAIQKVADTRVTVLIQGEKGTGKARVASSIHYSSNRANKMFVSQNCAALTESLLESELFGHERGAFAGASESKIGLFEIADGGTLFLNEVGEMSLALQAKLLSVLQAGEVRPVGSQKSRKIDVRVIASTHRNLALEVKEGRFREDLFHRLRVFTIDVPPLRDRPEDIFLLSRHFLKKHTRAIAKSVAGFTDETLKRMAAYSWPGNIDELENEIQRLIFQVQPNQRIEHQHLNAAISGAVEVQSRFVSDAVTLKQAVDNFERWVVVEALRKHNNNKSATAKSLGITREGFHKKLKVLGL